MNVVATMTCFITSAHLKSDHLKNLYIRKIRLTLFGQTLNLICEKNHSTLDDKCKIINYDAQKLFLIWVKECTIQNSPDLLTFDAQYFEFYGSNVGSQLKDNIWTW